MVFKQIFQKLALGLASMAAALVLTAAQAQASSATALLIKGDVTYTAAGAQAQAVQINAGDVVPEKSTVRTGSNSKAVLEPLTGILSVINANSVLVLESINVAAGNSASNVKLHLEEGAMVSSIDRERRDNATYTVSNSIGSAGIRGTTVTTTQRTFSVQEGSAGFTGNNGEQTQLSTGDIISGSGIVQTFAGLTSGLSTEAQQAAAAAAETLITQITTAAAAGNWAAHGSALKTAVALAVSTARAQGVNVTQVTETITAQLTSITLQTARAGGQNETAAAASAARNIAYAASAQPADQAPALLAAVARGLNNPTATQGAETSPATLSNTFITAAGTGATNQAGENPATVTSNLGALANGFVASGGNAETVIQQLLNGATATGASFSQAEINTISTSSTGPAPTLPSTTGSGQPTQQQGNNPATQAQQQQQGGGGNDDDDNTEDTQGAVIQNTPGVFITDF